MERWFRRIFEKAGGSLEGGAESSVRELSLKLGVQAQRALEREAVPEGATFVVPHRITLAVPYKLHCTLSEEARDALAEHVREVADNFIRDRRYLSRGTLQVEVVGDVFHDSPSVKVSFEETSGAVASKPRTLRLVGADGRELHSAAARPGLVVRLGRTRDNTVVLDDSSVSKFHAQLTIDDTGTLVLSDLGSTNGTFLADSQTPLEAGARPISGQRIRLGDVEFTVILE